MQKLLNKMMAILLAILLPLTAGMAQAGSRPAGSSGGFRGGFSSQKTVSQPTRSSNTAFGSFNTSKPAISRKSDSALNRDLEKNQAQANAQKSMDARLQASKPGNPQTGNTNNASAATVPAPMAAPAMTPPPIATVPAPMPIPMQAPAPVMVQRSSGILPAGIIGFMLGGMMSHPRAAESRPSQYEPIANQGGQGGQSGDGVLLGQSGNGAGSKPDDKSDEKSDGKAVVPSAQQANTAIPTTNASKSAVQEEGFGWKLLRLALWSFLIGGFAWLGHKIWRRLKRNNQQENAAHYRLGGN